MNIMNLHYVYEDRSMSVQLLFIQIEHPQSCHIIYMFAYSQYTCCVDMMQIYLSIIPGIQYIALYFPLYNYQVLKADLTDAANAQPTILETHVHEMRSITLKLNDTGKGIISGLFLFLLIHC